MRVSAFFNAPMLLIITDIGGTLYSEISGTDSFEIVACFKMKIEHVNLPRNNKKTPLWNPTADQYLRRAVSQCSDWW